MTNTSLLQFIIQLLGDEESRAEFTAHPREVLHHNGFDDLCAEDVRDARPLIVDNVQTVQSNSFDRELDGGGNSSQVHNQVNHTPPPPPPPSGGGGDDGMDGAIREIHYITQSYSWSDSHNTVLDNSVNQNIWAHGDVLQWFDNDPVIASGDGAVAAGDDIEGTVVTGDHNVVGDDNELTTVGHASASQGGAVSIGGGDATGEYEANDYSTDVEAYGSGNVAVATNGSHTTQVDSHDWESNDSHDVDHSVHVDDSYNTEHSYNTDDSHDSKIEDSYNTKVDDSYNTDNSDHSVEDSYNTKTVTNTETNTDNSTDFDDSFNSKTETETTTVTDNSVDIDDSFNHTDTDIASNNHLDVDVDVDHSVIVA